MQLIILSESLLDLILLRLDDIKVTFARVQCQLFWIEASFKGGCQLNVCVCV